ncbi:MAG TPA: hypothetical protein VGR73_17400 [Bryobacteraceae bacterium]|nr:hypothetical protein [Bryobacteraceae bacterium]
MRLSFSTAWTVSLLAPLVATLVYAQGPTVGTCPVFPVDHIWNTPIETLPVSPSSSTWVSTIGPSAPLHPDFGSGLYNGGPIGIPFVTVPGTQTKYPATFTYQSESDPGPYAIPLDAPIEGGSSSTGDRHVISVDVTNCILYEIYDAFPQTASWTGGSGAIFNLLGYALRPATWTSADAAGLPIFPGLVRYDEIMAGHIDHAIRFTVPQTQKAYVWPARHYASSLTGTQYPPMGARFRLKASFNISTFSATNQIILRALQKYGMFLADNGSAWFISGAPDSHWDNNDLHALTTIAGSNFEAVDDTTLTINVDSGQALQNSAVSVTVTPPTANVVVNGSQAFNAVVNNAGTQTVNWDVNGVVPGTASTGTINSAGVYTAPSAVPSPATVAVHATSATMPPAVGSATVTITPGVTISISPTAATVKAGRIKQFFATVHNTTNTAVTWKVNGVTLGSPATGTITPKGVYTAPKTVPTPATVTVSAVSIADPTKSAGALVTIWK